MTGLRLDGSNALSETMDYRKALPEVTTLPQHFLGNGYVAASFGKVNHLHPYVLDPASWSEPESCYDVKKRDEYLNPHNRLRGFIHPMAYGEPTESVDAPDDAYQDGQAATAALEKLHEWKDQRFFLAVGFKRPHLPFSAPKKYWDYYRPEDIPLPEHPELPDIGEAASWRHLTNYGEFRQYKGMPASLPLTEAQARRLRHGYYACASYIDAQLGRLLDGLEQLGLREETLIVFWADHGMHLGESGLWGKKTVTELDTRVPLLFSWPGHLPANARRRALAELIDVYPTMAELAGLPFPQGIEGTSLCPVMENPEDAGKEAAFSQCRDTGREIWGCSIRTDRFRYSEWFPARRPDQTLDRELYLIEEDPLERNNLAAHPEYAEELQRHTRILQRFTG